MNPTATPRVTTLVAGVDGAPFGWVAAVGTADGSRVWLSAAKTLKDLVSLYPRVRYWAVDIPIGLSEDGPRACDSLARQRLGGSRGSSVFPAPVRTALAATGYSEACRLSAAACGKKLSKQAWNIAPKIGEARRLLIARPPLRRRMFETHPELCFQRLAGGVALVEPKKSAAGRQLRRRLLSASFGQRVVEAATAQIEATKGVGLDDAYDAMACWTAAARAAAGQFETLPPAPHCDADGLTMAIAY